MRGLTKKVRYIILKMYDEGYITKKKCGLNAFSYYSCVWFLRDKKLITTTSVDNNNQKKWKLNDTGKKLAENLKAIYEIMGSEGEEDE